MRRAKKLKLPKRPPGQLGMFDDTCADLPLFSGTPPQVEESTFNPQPQPRQKSLFGPPTIGELAEEKQTR